MAPAEMLRALLMVQVGAEPEGLTESAARHAGAVSRAARAGRHAPDAAAARRQRDRRSGGAAMPGWWWRRCCSAGRCWTGWSTCRLCSTVPRRRRRSRARARVPPSPASAASRRRAASGPAPVAPPAPAAAACAGARRVAFNREALTAAWADIVARGARREPLPRRGPGRYRAGRASAPPASTLRLTDQDAGLALTPRAAARAVERPCSVQIVGAAGASSVVADGDAAPAQPRSDCRPRVAGRRLKGLRVRDPALDAAAEALDLEIVE